MTKKTTAPRFASPADFKNYYLSILEKNIKRKDKPNKFRELSERHTSVSWENMNDSHFIDSITRDGIYLVMQDGLRTDLEQKFSFGVLNNPEINAKVIKHRHDNFYAVLFYHGLLSYLSLFLRLRFAAMDPGAVAYCQGVDTIKATADTYNKMFGMTVSAYHEIGIPLGFAIHLKDEYHAAHASAFYKMLIFIASHEIGHYINGDFNNEESAMECPFDNQIKEYKDISDEESQNAADIYGYQILRKLTVMRNNYEHSEADDLECITALFSAFSYTAKTRHESLKYASRFLDLTRYYYKNNLPLGYDENTINNWRRDVYGIHVL